MLTDYAFYAAEYHGTLTEAEFNAAYGDAYAELLSRTAGAALTAPAAMTNAVQRCLCALADIFSGYKKAVELLPRGVATLSNDGLTVATGGAMVTVQSPTQAQNEEIASICARYLQYPMNLMSRWI
jgi:hypothetical protein